MAYTNNCSNCTFIDEIYIIIYVYQTNDKTVIHTYRTNLGFASDGKISQTGGFMVIYQWLESVKDHQQKTLQLIYTIQPSLKLT